MDNTAREKQVMVRILCEIVNWVKERKEAWRKKIVWISTNKGS